MDRGDREEGRADKLDRNDGWRETEGLRKWRLGEGCDGDGERW